MNPDDIKLILALAGFIGSLIGAVAVSKKVNAMQDARLKRIEENCRERKNICTTCFDKKFGEIKQELKEMRQEDYKLFREVATHMGEVKQYMKSHM